jgi:hypothetical protein
MSRTQRLGLLSLGVDALRPTLLKFPNLCWRRYGIRAPLTTKQIGLLMGFSVSFGPVATILAFLRISITYLVGSRIHHNGQWMHIHVPAPMLKTQSIAQHNKCTVQDIVKESFDSCMCTGFLHLCLKPSRTNNRVFSGLSSLPGDMPIP